MPEFHAQFDRTSDLLANVRWSYSDYESEESRSPANVRYLFENGRWITVDDYLDAHHPRVVAPYQALLYREGIGRSLSRTIKLPYRSIEELPHKKEYYSSHILLLNPPTQTTFVEPIVIHYAMIPNPIGDALYSYSAVIPIRFT